MSAKITDKAKGETIHLHWEVTSYASYLPASMGGLFFIMTLVDTRDRTARMRITTPDIVAELENSGTADAVMRISYPLDTMDGFFDARVDYECDLWVVDPAVGNKRLDTWFLNLDEPETVDFSQA